MTLRITDDRITSDVTNVYAEFNKDRAADGFGGWIVNVLPMRIYNRDQAVSAIQAAQVYAENPPRDDPVWWHVKAWEAELNLTGGPFEDWPPAAGAQCGQ